MVTILEQVGCITGLTAAWLIACKTGWSRFSFFFGLISSLCWVFVAIVQQQNALAITQAGFMLASLFGIYRWIYCNSDNRTRAQGGTQ